MSNTSLIQRMIAKCIWWVVFGVWVEDVDAKILAGWRSEAENFVLPELIHRAMCNRRIKRIQQLRIDTGKLVEKYGVHRQLARMNNSLPKQHRPDELQNTKHCSQVKLGSNMFGDTNLCSSNSPQSVHICALQSECMSVASLITTSWAQASGGLGSALSNRSKCELGMPLAVPALLVPCWPCQRITISPCCHERKRT